MDIYQDNLNSNSEITENNIKEKIFVKPLVFYHFYENIKFLENSNKILIPKNLLYKISKFENLEFPLNIKINNYIFGVYEFREDIDDLYISNTLFNKLEINLESEYTIEFLINKIPKGNFIKLKPHTNNFSEIIDQKKYLEHNLKSMYTCLHLNDTISMPYNCDYGKILFDIIDCQPENIISLIDTDIEVDIDTSYEYDNYKKLEEQEKVEAEKRFTELKKQEELKKEKNLKKDQEDSKDFIPFSGKGNKLGNS